MGPLPDPLRDPPPDPQGSHPKDTPMALETATYISDLVATNPAASDPTGQGDDHIRILKATLQATFPSVAGAVSATHTDLSALPALRTTVATNQTNMVSRVTDTASTASLTITGTGKFLDAPSLKQGGNVLLPRGAIIMWSGALSAVPAGWQLCDGTNGTPDLRGVFVLGAGAAAPYPAALLTGGSTVFTGATSVIAGHTHGASTGVAGGHSHTGTTSTAGSHSHGGTVGGHVLSLSEIPSHDHGLGSSTIITFAGAGGSTGLGAPSNAGSVNSSPQGGGASHDHTITADGGHSHTTATSAVADHAHSIASDGGHSHTATVSGLPPYVALGLIMKL